MNGQTFSDVLTRLRTADYPQEVFGSLTDMTLDELQRAYRKLAMVVHPDHNAGCEGEADEAFVLLQKWVAEARRAIERRINGEARPTIRIASRHNRYSGDAYAVRGDLSDLFPVNDDAGETYLLKVVRNPLNNDLMAAEVKQLRLIDRKLRGEPLRAHFPTLKETFMVGDDSGRQRRTNALNFESEFITLQEIIEAYPGGIDAADMAWIFNRLLVILGITHSFGIVHGAVVPDHIMVRLSDHNGMLIDWCYSVDVGQTVLAVSRPNKAYYAPELLAKETASEAADIYMAAQCMVKLLGGNVATGDLPDRVPLPIKKLLQTCLIPSPHRRANDAWELFETFNKILKKLYGKPKFRAFRLPN